MIKAPLKIALIAPSSVFEHEALKNALKKAEDSEIIIINNAQRRLGVPGFLNGTKAQRLGELKEAEDLGAHALWCVRGGCGALELWHDYGPEYYADKKAVLVGYSDATILHFQRFYQAERIGLHAPVFLDFDEQISAIKLLLSHKAEHIYYPPLKKINHFLPAQIRGPLIVMNLISLASLVGSFKPDFLRGKILAIEDTNEPLYKIFRAMSQLKNAGILIGLKALLVGHMSHDREQIIKEVLLPLAQDYAIPLFDWPIFGHEKPNWPLLFGAHVTIGQVEEHLFTLKYNEQHDHTPCSQI